MLPDFVKARDQFMKMVLDKFEKLTCQYMGPFDFPKNRIFEGRQLVSVMKNGQVFKTSLAKISGEINILNNDVKTGNIAKVLEYIDQMALDRAQKQTGITVEEFKRVTSPTGQMTDYGGRPFDADAFFTLIEKVEIDFKKDGSVKHLRFVYTPELDKRVKEVLAELESNPEYKKRYKEIIDKKRQEWNDREASRKLVG